MIMVRLLAGLGFLGLGGIIVYQDWRLQKIRNSHIRLGLWLCLALYALQFAVTLSGLAHFASDYAVLTFYPAAGVHLAISLAAALALWWLDIWPAGDAKLFILCAAFVPLITPDQKMFPRYLSLELAVNIFILATLAVLLRQAWLCLNGWRRWPDHIQSAIAWTRRYAAGLAAWRGAIPYISNLLAVVLGFSLLRHLAAANAQRRLSELSLLYLGLMLLWQKCAPFFADIRLARITMPATVGLIGLALLHDPAGCWTLCKVSLQGLLGFSLFFMVVQGLLNRHLLRTQTKKVPFSALQPGMLLTTETHALLSRDPAYYQDHFVPLFRDGLTQAQTEALRQWLMGLPPDQGFVTIWEGRAFAPWIVAGTIFTLIFAQPVPNLLWALWHR